MSSEVNVPESQGTVVGSEPSSPPPGTIWRTIRGYILWSHERGSLHYDIMVTLILVFVFVSPYLINYKDKPVEHNPHPTGVAVTPDTEGGLIFQIEGSAVNPGTETEVRQQLEQIIEPISGAVSISKYETVRDAKGRVQSYKVWVEKE